MRSREPAATVGETLTHAKKHAFERQSVLSEKRLLAEALKRGYGSVEVEEVKRSFSQAGDVIRRQMDGQTLVTTKEVLAEEAAVIAFARDGRGTCTPLSAGRGVCTMSV